MSTTTNLSTLKINYLTQEQYEEALNAGTLNEHEFYMTPFDDGGGWYLLLSGGNVTGPVNFGESVSINELTVGDLVVNGRLTVGNNIITYGTEDLTSGSSDLASGTLYVVYS